MLTKLVELATFFTLRKYFRHIWYRSFVHCNKFCTLYECFVNCKNLSFFFIKFRNILILTHCFV